MSHCRFGSKFGAMAICAAVIATCLLLSVLQLRAQSLSDFRQGNDLVVDGVALDDPLNLRTQPGVGAKIDRRLPLGTTGLVATGKHLRVGGVSWIEVRYRGRTGWVNARFVRAVQPLPVTPPGIIAVPGKVLAEQSYGKRVALVVGNAQYSATAPLRNPTNDARAMADALKRVGFERVALHIDVSKKQLTDAIADFVESARDAKLALIYFAGHGLQIDGTSYLLPIDAKLDNADNVASQAVELSALLRQLDTAAALKLVIVDACRDNPFRDRLAATESARSRSTGYVGKSIGRGLGRVESAGHDTLVAYAARDGSLAFDGDGANSPFATAILKQLDAPGTEVGLMFRRVRDHVLAATGKRQEPFTYGSIGGEEVYLWPVEGGLELKLSATDYNERLEKTSSLKKETDAVVATFKNGDLKGLALYVHPISGALVDGVTLHRKDLLNPGFAEKVFQWEDVGSGYTGEKPIASVRAYLMKALHGRDYLGMAEVSFGERKVGGGASLDPIFHSRPGSVFVDYFVPPGPPGSDQELNWSTLRLIFEKMNSRWFLAEVQVKGWEP